MTAESELLRNAVREVARLLQVDGAMIYLLEPETGELRFAHDAGITNPEARRLIQDLTLSVGVGMFGTAVASGKVTVTDDYPVDRRFTHSEVADRIVAVAGMRSMAVAPLMANDEPLGALGAYSNRPAAFDQAQLALLKALAEHAATAIANQRLLGRLAASEERYRTQALELAHRVATQRTLHRIAAQITAIRDPDEALQQVVDGAKRLLGSDGAHLTLRDPELPVLRPHVMAGGTDEETRAWMAVQEFPIGGGMNGLAAMLGEPVWTHDYLVDPRIPHTDDDQAVANRMGLRGMAVAPLRAPGGEIFGTLAVSFERPRETTGDEIELLQGLADIGAIAIANARLYEQLSASKESLKSQAEELARVVEVQRTLGEIARRIVEVDDAAETLQQVVDASKRLLGSDGAHLTLMNDEGTHLVPMVLAGDESPERRAWLHTQRFPVGGGINGLAASTGKPTWTDDYLNDPRIPHDPDDDAPRRLELGAVAVAPLHGVRGEVIGTLAITYREPRRIDPRDVALLEELAGQGAIAARNARLYQQLRERAEAQARAAEAQRTLAEIAGQITSIRDPGRVLMRTVDEAKRLLGADDAVIDRYQPEIDLLRELTTEDLTPILAEVHAVPGQGIAGAALASGQVRRTGDYLADDSFVHDTDADEWMRRHGYRSQMSAPLAGEAGPIGTLTVYSMRPNAFDEADAQLLGTLASHAAIVQSNARLYAEARRAADDLARLVEAQRTLSAIATQITSIRDPRVVLQRTVDEAHRLLAADLALINQFETEGGFLEWAVAHAPRELSLDDVIVVPGQGVSGTALSEMRVVRTGDYLNDPAFPHTPELDEYIQRRGMRSVMSAPLAAGGEPLGTLTVQAARAHAFSEDDAQLLGALAAQAAVAISNARLLEQLAESERRYRHLVDHSPDLVWSVDAEGHFTYLGESLERITGFRPHELLGSHWERLVGGESLEAARAAWRAVRERPEDDLQFRIQLPLAGGGTMAAEVNMVGILVDGRFAGAQGSIRDIRERERLEEDLRRQAAALAANEERANLARELHDSVTQALFSMGLTARALEMVMERDPAAAREKIRELRDLQRDALAEMRTLIFELRPQALETDGLAQALRNHGAAVHGRTGLSVSVEVEYDERMPLDVEEALYRIAQEALHNVVKHANAQHATIGLRRVGRELRLTVEDDGVGFDPQAIPRGHLGVVGMRQRAERIGAELSIGRRPSGGTKVRVSLPLPGTVIEAAATGPGGGGIGRMT
ncbi:MAG TPA: GAF domain-containing protein [candidate division Zixibacteria bacterium]|nr:GAF domain-containing protein [candidate division Zixibacteria bacterium]